MPLCFSSCAYVWLLCQQAIIFSPINQHANSVSKSAALSLNMTPRQAWHEFSSYLW